MKIRTFISKFWLSTYYYLVIIIKFLLLSFQVYYYYLMLFGKILNRFTVLSRCRHTIRMNRSLFRGNYCSLVCHWFNQLNRWDDSYTARVTSNERRKKQSGLFWSYGDSVTIRYSPRAQERFFRHFVRFSHFVKIFDIFGKNKQKKNCFGSYRFWCRDWISIR